MFTDLQTSVDRCAGMSVDRVRRSMSKQSQASHGSSVKQAGRPMQLSIRNLGCIESADVPIAPLTVFIGPNNTNKTWAAYALYGLAKAVSYLWTWGPGGKDDYYQLALFEQPLKDNIEAIVTKTLDFLTKGADGSR